MVAKARDMTMDFLLQYPVTAIPTGLFHEDGQMRKTKKDDLAHKLEEKVKSEVNLPHGETSNTVLIRDAMSIIQSMNGDQFNTFDDLGNGYLQGIKKCLTMANTMTDVFDRYDKEDSVKEGERKS